MRNRISETICLVLVAVFVLAGCRQQQEEDTDVLELTRDADVISIPSDEAMRAIKASGGLNAWKEITQLQFDCVVTFYQPDGSFYLTEQHYEVNPWLNSIQISADESQGAFIWQWSEGRFNILKGAGQIDALSKEVPSSCFAEVIFNIITAPVRFIDGSVEFSKQSDPVRIQGKWYYPINRQEKVFTGRISEAVFYQNRSSSLVDMVRLACTGTGMVRDRTVQYVRGYDYQKIEKTGIRVPARIEIFETDARDRSQNRLVKIDCHSVTSAQ